MGKSLFSMVVEYLKGLDPELGEEFDFDALATADDIVSALIMIAVRNLGGDGLYCNYDNPPCSCCFSEGIFPCSDGVDYILLHCVPAKNQAVEGCVHMEPLEGDDDVASG